MSAQFTLADAFLEGLAAQDFAQLGGALAAAACLRASRLDLLCTGYRPGNEDG